MATMAGKNTSKPDSKAGDFSDLFSKTPPASSSLPKRVGKREIIQGLKAFGVLSSTLLTKMNFPEHLFKLSTGNFSSDKKIPAYSITHARELEGYESKDFPEYSISIGERGSNVFCTFVDKKRGVLVSTSIKNMMAGEGSWEFFEHKLTSALDEAHRRTPKDIKEGNIVMLVS